MADGFDAGSILVSLRAQLDDFNSGINSAKETLDSLAQAAPEVTVAFQELNTGVVVFEELEAASTQTAAAFDRMGLSAAGFGRTFNDLGSETGVVRQSFQQNTQAVDDNEKTFSRAGTTWARSASRILSIQVALLSLSGTASGPVKEALQAISNGVNTATGAFIAINSIAPGTLSGLGAGFIGVGAAIVSFFVRSLEDSIKQTNAATDAMEQMRVRTEALSHAISDAKLTISVFGGTLSDQLESKLRLSESAFESNLKRIREIGDEIRKLNSADTINPGQIEALQQERLNLNRQNDDIRMTGAFDKANADVAKLNQSLSDTKTKLEDTEISGEAALKFGVAQPAEVAADNLKAAKAVYDQLIADNLKIVEESQKYNLSLEQQDAILAKLHPQSQIQAAADNLISKQQYDNAVKSVNDLASTFSTSIGDGLRTAIESGQKPLQALATVGQNLFNNMVDQAMKRLETGLQAAFKAVTGVSGDLAGSILSGAMGVAGLFLSKLGSNATQTQASIQSGVTSTQAVQGIVAGPSSIAIAQVASDLTTALAPVVSALALANSYLQKIVTNTAAGGGSGSQGNVAVATR